MSKFLLPLAVFTVLSVFAFGQSSSTHMGARSNALGYASSCLSDEWSLFNNVGGLAKLEHTTAFFSYVAHPSISSFSRIAAGFALPLKFGVAGFGLFRFGDALYNEQVATAAFSNTFGLASLGLTINYIQYSAEGFGTKGVISAGFGGIARLTPHLSVGTYITNLNQPKLSLADDERLPTQITAGVLFTLTEKVIVVTELEKDLDHTPKWKTGLEYRFNKKFCARTGFNLNPDAAFMGIGFASGKFILDYAFQYNALLGSSHQATVGYPFKKKKK